MILKLITGLFGVMIFSVNVHACKFFISHDKLEFERISRDEMLNQFGINLDSSSLKDGERNGYRMTVFEAEKIESPAGGPLWISKKFGRLATAKIMDSDEAKISSDTLLEVELPFIRRGKELLAKVICSVP